MTSPREDRPAWNAGGRPSGVWTGQEGQQSPASADSLPRTDASGDGTHCFQCGKTLERDEIGLYKKLVNRGARTYLCKPCLAAKFKMTEDDCDTLIAHFKEAGCSMFF